MQFNAVSGRRATFHSVLIRKAVVGEMADPGGSPWRGKNALSGEEVLGGIFRLRSRRRAPRESDCRQIDGPRGFWEVSDPALPAFGRKPKNASKNKQAVNFREIDPPRAFSKKGEFSLPMVTILTRVSPPHVPLPPN